MPDAPNPLPPLPASNLIPAPVHPTIQAALDADHLRLLEIGFYISGVLTALRFIWFFFIAAIFAVAGVGSVIAARAHSDMPSKDVPPEIVFFIIAVFFGVIILLTLIFAGLEIYAGMCLKKRKHPVMIQVVAAIYCLSIPWGTALGVFTFMVLNRPSVKPLFAPKI